MGLRLLACCLSAGTLLLGAGCGYSGARPLVEQASAGSGGVAEPASDPDRGEPPPGPAARYAGVPGVSSPGEVSAADLAGAYYRGDGKGYNLSLTLNADGTYAARWRGCLGEYGKGHGAWTLRDQEILIHPEDESGMMIGHIRSLVVLWHEGSYILVPKDDDEFFLRWGVSRSSCFASR